MTKVVFTKITDGFQKSVSERLKQLPMLVSERILRKTEPAAQAGSLAGYLLVCHLLSTGDSVLSGLHFSRTGKPLLPGTASFNFSHAGDIVVATVGEAAIGIDVESVRPVNLSMYKDYCSDEEWLLIAHAHHPLTCFYQLWTRKEAVAKAMGTGVEHGLQRLEVIFDTVVVDGTRYHLQEIQLGEGCVCHLAQASPDIAAPPVFIDAERL